MKRMWWVLWGGCRLRFAPAEPGEIVYQQLGATRSAVARSEDGEALAKAEEVYVIRYEKGVAYVKRWEDIEQGLGTRDSKQTTSR